MAGMILPERTFDIWVSLAVVRMSPQNNILVWGPTPIEQANCEPYDLAINGLVKPLFLENKGLQGNRKIIIEIEQFKKLFLADLKARLEFGQRGKTRGFLWYALPMFNDLNLRDFAWQCATEDEALVFSPMGMFIIASRIRRSYNWLRQKTITLDVVKIRRAQCRRAVGYPFRDFFKKVQRCLIGVRLESSDVVNSIMNHVTRQMFMPVSIEEMLYPVSLNPVSIEENELMREYLYEYLREFLREQMEGEQMRGENLEKKGLNKLVNSLIAYDPNPGAVPMAIPFPV